MDSNNSFSGIAILATKHNKYFLDELQGEFIKTRPPNFNGESGELTKPWLLDIKRYLQIYKFSSNLKCTMALF